MHLYNKMVSIIIFTLLFTFSVNATLITTETNQLNYNAGDIVVMDVFVNEAKKGLIWLEFDLTFDDIALSFDHFIFENLVVENALYLGAFDWGFDDLGTYISLSPLTIQVGLINESPFGSHFKLGTAEFMANSNVTPNIAVTYLDVQTVHEPSTIFIFILGVFVFLFTQARLIKF